MSCLWLPVPSLVETIFTRMTAEEWRSYLQDRARQDPTFITCKSK